ncbi:MAG: cysteine desulfurase [Bacteroidales bacterium]|nr:cysteine desulfurase [Bacteroidales bacterium]
MKSEKEIRNCFPILTRLVNGKPLVYFDNAATTQKPEMVIDALANYYREQNANIHRGVHFLSQISTDDYEGVRKQIARFIHARTEREIVFTRGTTESINLVASSFGRQEIQEGDEIVLTTLEHHSNIVPWQINAHGAIIRTIPVTPNGELDMHKAASIINRKTRMVAIAHISNALGTILPVREIIDLAHKNGALVLVDGAQAIAHTRVDVQELDADFYCFSGHKMYAPMGIGALYGKEELLERLPPYQGGGEMIDRVSFENTTYNDIPFKFEAGTPNVGDTLALGKAISFIEAVSYEKIAAIEEELLHYATERLSAFDGVKIIGLAANKAGVISFVVDNIHPYDIGMILDKTGVAARTGHHCAQPLMDFYQLPGTVRISFAMYNTKEEVDIFIDSLKMAIDMLT